MIIRLSWAYIVVCIAIGINAILNLIFTRYNVKENTRNLPIRGILNVAKGIVWAIAVIIGIALIVHRSPAALLGGLGAFAAALMLIFKDSILGFVAGIQMSQNDMLHVGDWIVVPGTPANGTVMDVSLTTVKVQNFDNTTVTVPPYTLVSTSFQNWRSMSESGVRRVMMNVYVNPDTVRFATAEMLQKLGEKYDSLHKFITNLQANNQTVACNTGTGSAQRHHRDQPRPVQGLPHELSAQPPVGRSVVRPDGSNAAYEPRGHTHADLLLLAHQPVGGLRGCAVVNT